MEPENDNEKLFNEALVILKRRIKELHGVMKDATSTIERCTEAVNAATDAWNKADNEATNLIHAVEVLEKGLPESDEPFIEWGVAG